MSLSLKPHPDHPGPAIDIDADVARARDELALRYRISGDVAALRIPPAAEPRRAHQLWQHLCLEAFLAASPGGPYCELNFAPSRQWAAYRFRSHRSGMQDIAIAAPRIDVEAADGSLELQARMALAGLPELPADAAWRLGLSAVIEEMDGRKSYWALAHPPGKADFHHPDSFAFTLAPAA